MITCKDCISFDDYDGCCNLNCPHVWDAIGPDDPACVFFRGEEEENDREKRSCSNCRYREINEESGNICWKCTRNGGIYSDNWEPRKEGMI